MEDCDPLVSSLLNPRPGKMEYLACVYLYVCSFHDDDRASTIPGTVIYVVLFINQVLYVSAGLENIRRTSLKLQLDTQNLHSMVKNKVNTQKDGKIRTPRR